MIEGCRPGALMRILAPLLLAALVAGCNTDSYGPKHLAPLSAEIVDKMKDIGSGKHAPILVRVFKQESALEIWKETKDGSYALLKTYDICKWSGQLGPKLREGDKQAPEGFYVVTPAQMNPKSSYHLSFNLGYPNTFDRAHGRTGKHLMVHGACSSAGCYAMTDEQIREIYSIARDAFNGGQRAFHVHAFPFRMTPENLVRHQDNPNMPFWRNLKEGHDHFEISRRAPSVDVCERRYVFNASLPDGVRAFNPGGRCPAYEVPDAIALAVAEKARSDDQAVETIIAERKAEAERKQQIAERREERQKKIEKTTAAIAGVFDGLAEIGTSRSDEADDDTGAETTVTAEALPAENPDTVAYTGTIDAATAYRPTAETDQDAKTRPFFRRLFRRSEAAAAENPEPAGDGAAVLPESNPRRTDENTADAEPPKKKGGIVGSVLSVFSSTD